MRSEPRFEMTVIVGITSSASGGKVAGLIRETWSDILLREHWQASPHIKSWVLTTELSVSSDRDRCGDCKERGRRDWTCHMPDCRDSCEGSRAWTLTV